MKSKQKKLNLCEIPGKMVNTGQVARMLEFNLDFFSNVETNTDMFAL